jgi:DNA-binding GntR family transcriptional regulator
MTAWVSRAYTLETVTHVDPNDPRSPYQQIADDLRRRIGSGELGPGVRMESTRKLATRYGVAAMTIHQAVRVLRDEGLVQSWQGRGTFIRTEGQELPQDLTSVVQDLHARVDALASEGASTNEQLAEIRRQLARAQTQIIELYTRAGLPYPRDGAADAPRSSRRKASGE